MASKWVYRFSEVDRAEAYADGNWDGVRGLLGEWYHESDAGYWS